MPIERAPRLYVALRGSHINNPDAQIVGPELDDLASVNGGITPAAVVERAATPGTALNKWDTEKGYFEWNDEDAAGAYREGQARRLIRAVVVKVDTGTETVKTRAFHSVRYDDNSRRYQPVEQIAQDSELVRQVRDRFQNELIRIDEQYRAYLSFIEFEASFGGVFKEIEKVVEKAPRTKREYRRRGSTVSLTTG